MRSIIVIAVLILAGCTSGDNFVRTDPSDPTWRLNEAHWGSHDNALLTRPPPDSNYAR